MASTLNFYYSVLVSGSPMKGDDKYHKEGSIDSTDMEPTGDDAAHLADGSYLTESDTGKVFFFNEKSGTWVLQTSFQGDGA